MTATEHPNHDCSVKTFLLTKDGFIHANLAASHQPHVAANASGTTRNATVNHSSMPRRICKKQGWENNSCKNLFSNVNLRASEIFSLCLGSPPPKPLHTILCHCGNTWYVPNTVIRTDVSRLQQLHKKSGTTAFNRVRASPQRALHGASGQQEIAKTPAKFFAN
jgi:hypothetical protein